MTYSFLLAVALIAAPPSEHDKAAISYLQTLQTPAGGFYSFPPLAGSEPIPSLRTTRTALRAFRLLGGEPANREAVVHYLQNCYDRQSGGFSDRPGATPDPISTSVALMIYGELKMPVAPYLEAGLKFMNERTTEFEQIRMVASSLEELDRRVPRADSWLELIDQARNPDGSYGQGPGQARTTALYVVAQLRLGGQPQSKERVLQILRSGQRHDGGFGADQPGGSDQESCYRIVRLLARLNAQPDDPQALRNFIASCHNSDGGYGRTPHEPSSLHGTYYATIIRYWLDGGQ